MAHQRKFQLGDQVHFTKRVPQYVLDKLRKRTRTVVSTYYHEPDQCVYYDLGDRGKGSRTVYSFRSYHLAPAGKQRRGRPKQKRRYRTMEVT